MPEQFKGRVGEKRNYYLSEQLCWWLTRFPPLVKYLIALFDGDMSYPEAKICILEPNGGKWHIQPHKDNDYIIIGHNSNDVLCSYDNCKQIIKELLPILCQSNLHV